jgi:ABC-type multidrug transport system ATPase subunit
MIRVRVGGQERAFSESDVVTFGRDRAEVIHLDDGRVSRQHLRLRADDTGWLVEDLRSMNGTYHGDEPITELRVTEPLTLRLGDPDTGVLIEFIPDPIEQPRPEAVAESGFPAGQRSMLVSQAVGELSLIHRPESDTVTIGRAPDNDIVVPDLLVSRRHAELLRGLDGSFTLRDLKSYNGIYVNGVRVSEARLEEFDIVTLGHHLFRFVGGAFEEYVDTGRSSFRAVGLTVRTPSDQVLVDDVSFSLGENSLLAIVGPSGSGKSTLLNALTGFRPADDGTVLYAERDLYQEYQDICQRIGYVPQEDILHAQLTVRQALTFAAQLRFAPDVAESDQQQRVDEVMAELGLSERADLPISRLSGGQRKRASIALELLTKPSLLFLDEPSSGLDPGYEKTLMHLLRELANGGRTVVVVTHSVQSLEICDRVLFLAPGGKVAYFGPPKDVLSYFSTSDYADVFTSLDRDRSTDWQARFRASPLYREYVQRPMVVPGESTGQMETPGRPTKPSQSWAHQFDVLVRRYVAVLLSDRRNLAFLFLTTLACGLLINRISPTGSFDTSSPGIHAHAGDLALMVILAISFVAEANAIREIVKELPIYRRERSAGLSISAYIASKVVVLSGLIAVQTVILVESAVRGQGGPSDPLMLGWGRGELLFDVLLAGLAAGSVALLVSALVNTSDKAITLIPVLLVPQMVLAGLIFPLEDRPAMRVASSVVSSNWGFSLVASTIDLNQLNGHGPGQTQSGGYPSDSRWNHTPSRWLGNALMLVILTGAPTVGTYLALRRRDTVGAAARKRAGFFEYFARRPTVQKGLKKTTSDYVPRIAAAIVFEEAIRFVRRLL